MKIIEPDVNVIVETNPFKKIELIGRTCYKSENKITEDSSYKFIDMLLKRKHLAMLEHYTFVFVWDNLYFSWIEYLYDTLRNIKHSYLTYNFQKDRIIFSANLRVLLENNYCKIENNNIKFLDFFSYSSVYFYNSDITDRDCFIYHIPDIEEYEILKHGTISMRFICDRGVSHEVVRHRLFSFAQESTRYVRYNNSNMEFIKPANYYDWDSVSYILFKKNCEDIERMYCYLLEKGRTPQEARAILPNSLKTEIIVTGNLEEWLHFFNLRCAKDAHPDMQIVAKKARDLFKYYTKIIPINK